MYYVARPRSFRLADALVAALGARARERGETTSALAERYLEEGLRRDAHPLIVFRDGAAGRRPSLAGTRVDVAHVVDTLVDSKKDVEETAAYLDLPEPHVRAAIRYYADYRDEVDAWREHVHSIAEREREAWEREQAVLA
jgi:uncharacterized protein (DUF433 family)